MNKLITSLCHGIYYSIAIRMPKSNARISFGAKTIRYLLTRGFIEHLGRNVNIERGAVFGKHLSVGDNSGIGINCVIQGNVTIGDNVMMGPEVYIYTRNHCHESIDIPMIQQGFENEKPVVIGNDVWIGSRVTILPGVSIGDGSIIGTCSVVTKDVPSYSIVAGNPAHVVKERR